MNELDFSEQNECKRGYARQDLEWDHIELSPFVGRL